MEPELPRQASKSKPAEGSARSSDTESAMPETSGGDWEPCSLDEGILSSLEREDRVTAKEISRWQVDPGAIMPAPSDGKVVMLKSHIDRGLSLPPSYFPKGVFQHFRLQLHHIAPNSFTAIAGFVALCEGIWESTHAETYSAYILTSVTIGTRTEILAIAGQSSLFPRAGKHTPILPRMILQKGWRGSFFYLADQAPPERKYGLWSFVDGPAMEQDSWGVMDDFTMDEECQLCSQRISKLVFSGQVLTPSIAGSHGGFSLFSTAQS
jgi:hypothetical protein